MRYRVSIVEDDAGVRAGLVRLFNESRNFQCVSNYATAESALAELPGQKPDVILMYINLPGINGIECVRRLKDKEPSLLVVMLTVYEETEQVFQALQAGATGYLLKRTPPKVLLQEIQEVLDGGAPITSHIARKVVEAFHARSGSKVQAETVELSQREKEVLAMLSDGYLIKEIADKLDR